MRFTEVKILTNADMSQASIHSNGVQLQQGVNLSIQAVWTGAPVGTLIVQVSDDIVAPSPGADPAANVVNWSKYTGSDATVNGAGDIMWVDRNSGYQWIRILYAKISGTGTLNATFSGKGP